MENKINAILRDEFTPASLDGMTHDCIMQCIEDATKAIAKMVATQPVDRARAMSLFVYASDFIKNRYYTPDGYRVDMCNDTATCGSDMPFNRGCATESCIHIQAVEMYRAAQEHNK